MHLLLALYIYYVMQGQCIYIAHLIPIGNPMYCTERIQYKKSRKQNKIINLTRKTNHIGHASTSICQHFQPNMW